MAAVLIGFLVILAVSAVVSCAVVLLDCIGNSRIAKAAGFEGGWFLTIPWGVAAMIFPPLAYVELVKYAVYMRDDEDCTTICGITLNWKAWIVLLIGFDIIMALLVFTSIFLSAMGMGMAIEETAPAVGAVFLAVILILIFSVSKTAVWLSQVRWYVKRIRGEDSILLSVACVFIPLVWPITKYRIREWHHQPGDRLFQWEETGGEVR